MRSRTLLVVLVALLAVSAMPAQAQNASAVASKHTTFGTSGGEPDPTTLEKMSVDGSGESASVTLDSGSPNTNSFEDEAADSGFPDGWSGDAASTTGEVTTSRAYSGSQSASVVGDNDHYMYYGLDSASTAEVSAAIYASSTTQYHLIELQDGTTRPIRVGIRQGEFGYYSGSGWTEIATEPDANEWIQIRIYDIDPDAETFNVEWTDPDGNSGTASLSMSASMSASGYDRIAVSGYDYTTYVDDVKHQQLDGTEINSGTYIGAPHSAEDVQQGWADITLNNASADITWQEDADNDSQWTNVTTQTVKTTANVTADLSGTQSDRWRVRVDFATTGDSATAQLHDEGLLFESASPTLSAPDPTGEISDYDGDIAINVSDRDLGLAQGDTVVLEATNESGDQIGQQSVTSNGTVTLSYDALAGANEIEWTATDDYGNSDSVAQSFTTPAELRIANESSPSDLVNGSTTVEVTFYLSNRTVTRNTTDGTVSLAGLPGGEPFTARAEADGYRTRTVQIPSLYRQQTMFLLPDSSTSVQARFTLEDATGTFSEQSTLYIEKPVTVDGNTSYQIIVSDQFGVDGVTTYLEKGIRYELRLKSQEGDVAQLGAYNGELNETIVLEPSVASVSRDGDGRGFRYSANYSDDAETIGIEFEDPQAQTSELTVSAVRQNGSVIKPEQTYYDVQSLSLSVPVAGGLNETAYVYFNATRGDDTYSIRAPVGPQQQDVVPKDLSAEWVQIGAAVGILLVGGAFSALNVGVGAAITSLFAGVLWFLGIMSGLASGATVAVAIGLSTLNLILKR
jgi:hypothetical protein